MTGHSMSCGVFSMPPFAARHRGGIRECADKLLSESAEVFAEARRLDRFQRCNASEEMRASASMNVAMEVADVLQVLRNLCDVCGVTPEMLGAACRECVYSNNSRDGGRYK